MRAVALSLGALMSIGPVLLAGTAVSADWKATERRVAATEIVTITPPPPGPLYYGGIMSPVRVEAKRTAMLQTRERGRIPDRCPSEPA